MPKYLIDYAAQAASAQIAADAARRSGELITVLGTSADADKVLSVASDSELERAIEAFGTPAGSRLFRKLRPYESEIIDAQSGGGSPAHYFPCDDASGNLRNPMTSTLASVGSGASFRQGGTTGGPLADSPSYALALDGTVNGWALQTNTNTMNALNSLAATFECWIRPANTGQYANLPFVFSYGNNAPGGVAANNSHIAIRFNTSGNIVGQLLWNNSALRASTHPTVLAANTWYHVVLSHHPTDGTITYVNGVAGPNTTGSVASMGNLSTLTGGGRLMLGTPWTNTAPAGNAFNGRVAHAAIYSGVAMSQATAQLHYMIGLKGTA